MSCVEAKAIEDGRLVLRFQDGGFKDPFIARHSDGTIKMFVPSCSYDPATPLLAVEEPENQLYPSFARTGRGVPALAAGRSVFVSTTTGTRTSDEIDRSAINITRSI